MMCGEVLWIRNALFVQSLFSCGGAVSVGDKEHYVLCVIVIFFF